MPEGRIYNRPHHEDFLASNRVAQLFRAGLPLKETQSYSAEVIPSTAIQQIADYYCRSRSWPVNRDWAKVLNVQ